jgi:transposase IS66 family protein
MSIERHLVRFRQRATLSLAPTSMKSVSPTLKPGGGPPDKPVILFDYDRSRSGKVAWRLTEDFKGYLQSDGFSGYDAVGKRDGVVQVGCLAHARRKFGEALKAQPINNRGGLEAEGLALIQRIYRIEKAAREAKLNPEQRKRLRDEATGHAAGQVVLDPGSPPLR